MQRRSSRRQLFRGLLAGLLAWLAPRRFGQPAAAAPPPRRLGPLFLAPSHTAWTTAYSYDYDAAGRLTQTTESVDPPPASPAVVEAWAEGAWGQSWSIYA
jgi:hypothetical protein